MQVREADDEDHADGGGTEEEKRKRRQDRHRVLERKRREKTQSLLVQIHQASCHLSLCEFAHCAMALPPAMLSAR